MKRRFTTSSLLAAALLFAFAGTAVAQELRDGGTVYIKPRIGLNLYQGDRDGNPDNEFGTFIEDAGPNFGIEIGYRISPMFGLGVLGTYGIFPALDRSSNTFPGIEQRTASDNRLSVHLVAPIHFATSGRVSPYIVPGIGIHNGKIDDPIGTQTGLSGMLGIGADIALSRRAGIFIEVDGFPQLSDDKFDGIDNDDTDNVFVGSAGIRFNITKPFVPVTILSATGPQMLETGQSGTWEAAVNADASQPVNYTWDFGDGNTATGLVASHSYASAGTYTVTLTADNGKSQDTRTMTVTVEDPIEPPSILAITATPQSPDTATPVSFRANVRGDGPFTYRWDFGDGTTGTGANPSHTYTTPGTYTVSLTATNEAGSDTRTMTIVVVPVEVDFCDTVVDMNSAFFNRNSSTLTADARAALQDNVQVLNDCPNMSVAVEGYAAPGERRGTSLAEARARAVEQFYIDNGIAASRIMASGRGVVTGVSRKEGTSQYRRVDSLPVR